MIREEALNFLGSYSFEGTEIDNHYAAKVITRHSPIGASLLEGSFLSVNLHAFNLFVDIVNLPEQTVTDYHPRVTSFDHFHWTRRLLKREPLGKRAQPLEWSVSDQLNALERSNRPVTDEQKRVMEVARNLLMVRRKKLEGQDILTGRVDKQLNRLVEYLDDESS